MSTLLPFQGHNTVDQAGLEKRPSTNTMELVGQEFELTAARAADSTAQQCSAGQTGVTAVASSE